MSWATSWGVGWGYFTTTPFTVVRALAVASNVVRVTFSQQPLFVSPIGVADAANLRNWTLVLKATGAPVNILATRGVAGNPLSVELVIAGKFQGALIEYEITAANIISTSISQLVDPKSSLFNGLPDVRVDIRQTRPLLDIQNLQTSSESFNGALSVGSSGDYLLEGGLPLMKKLIYRRLLTATSEFYHLSNEDYGAGIRAKNLFTPTGLVTLKKSVEVQVLREFEVEQVSATLTLARTGRLTIALAVKLRQFDQKISFSFPIQQQPALEGRG